MVLVYKNDNGSYYAFCASEIEWRRNQRKLDDKNVGIKAKKLYDKLMNEEDGIFTAKNILEDGELENINIKMPISLNDMMAIKIM